MRIRTKQLCLGGGGGGEEEEEEEDEEADKELLLKDDMAGCGSSRLGPGSSSSIVGGRLYGGRRGESVRGSTRAFFLSAMISRS